MSLLYYMNGRNGSRFWFKDCVLNGANMFYANYNSVQVHHTEC